MMIFSFANSAIITTFIDTRILGIAFMPFSARCKKPPIPVLFKLCSPTTITREVTSIIINAFNRMLWGWFSPHIIQKTRKTITPTIADHDSPTAIMFEGSKIGIIATLNHCCPRMIFRTTTTSMLPVTTMATTALRVTMSKIISLTKRFGSTITKAMPKNVTTFGTPPFSKCLKHTKSLSSKVVSITHTYYYNMLSKGLQGFKRTA